MQRIVFMALAWIGCEGNLGEVPCDDDLLDGWRVTASGEADLEVDVDTTSRVTTFDPAVLVAQPDRWRDDLTESEWVFLGGADDDEDCTFRPGNYECPSLELDIEDDVAVFVINAGACAGPVGTYRLDVEVDGKEADLAYLGLVDRRDLDTQEEPYKSPYTKYPTY